MISQRILKLGHLHIGFKVPAILTVLVASAALAQVHATGHKHVPQAKAHDNTTLDQSNTTPLFLPLVTYDSGGAGASSIAVADVNGDGYPDIVVTNQYSNNVAVLLGNGDGTFQPAVTYGCGGSSPMSLAAADLNGDGYADIAVVNQCGPVDCSHGQLAVLLNNGDGTFAPAVVYDSGGTRPTAVAIADLNHNGKPDLLVSDFSSGNVGVLLGNGDGTFQPAVTSYVSGYGSVAVAPLGPVPAVVVANGWDRLSRPYGNVTVLYPNSNGTLFVIGNYRAGYQPLSLAVGDVYPWDGPDIVVTNSLPSRTSTGDGVVNALLNEGGDEFVGPFRFSSGGRFPSSSAIGDINLDGIGDLVVGNNGAQDITVFFSTGWGGEKLFRPALTFNVGGYPNAVAIADVNGDGKPDVLVAASSSSTGLVGVLLNNATPAATLIPPSLNLGRQVLNQTSAAKTVKLKDSGLAPLNISSVTINGPFAISTNTCLPPLDMDNTCQVSVTFTPAVPGRLTGALTISDNAPNSPQTVALFGTGLEPATLLPASVFFKSQAMGTTSAPKTFTLTNNQAVSLTSLAISTTGDFAVSATTCTTTLAANADCTISVTFTPTATGRRTGELSISDSASNSPQTSNLTGTGK